MAGTSSLVAVVLLGTLLLWRTQVCGMQPAIDGANTKPMLLVLSSNNGTTNVAGMVQGVLQAAGVHVLGAGLPGGSPTQADTVSPQQGRLAAARHFQGGLTELQEVVKAHQDAHIIHLVQDVRQAVYDSMQHSPHEGQARLVANWSAHNMAIREWATTQGLGLARRYSIARVEDVCSTQHNAEAVKALLGNVGLSAVTLAVVAPAAHLCPSHTWQAGLASAGPQLAEALRAADASARAALLAFGYQPITGLGLPAWLDATAALSEVRAVADALAADRATAIVTFVGDGYEPILNNWLTWLKHAGVDVSRVVVIAGPQRVRIVRQKVRYRGVRVAALDLLEPTSQGAVEPGTSFELGLKSNPNKHARARVWLQRIRVLYEFVSAGVPVIMSDLDALWLRNAKSDLLSKPQGLTRGFDLIMSPGFFPFDVHTQMGVVGCMGFLYANSTTATKSLLGSMLLEKLQQLTLREVKFYNDQRVLNEQLLRANIALNTTTRPHPRGNPEEVLGVQLSTAPDALRVLFLADGRYARVCTNMSVTASSAVVVHCQAHNSGAAKVAFLHKVGLWKDGQGSQVT